MMLELQNAAEFDTVMVGLMVYSAVLLVILVIMCRLASGHHIPRTS